MPSKNVWNDDSFDEEDVCPDCHKSNGRSGSMEFWNSPLSDEDTKWLQDN